MNKDKTNVLLIEAKTYRSQGLFDKALENLHKVVNAHSDNLVYKYLLASTYFEAGSDETATQYAQEVINTDNNSKEALELLGLIKVREGKYEQAEEYYMLALKIDPNFHNARLNLIKLYEEYLKNNTKLAENGLYMISHRDVDKYLLSYKKKMSILLDWYAYVYARTRIALAGLKRYKEAIELTEEYIKFHDSCFKIPRPIDCINEYGNIYKYYYLLKDQEGLKSFKTRYLTIFNEYEERSKDFIIWEDLANKGVL